MKFDIKSDGTVAGTKLSLDGKDITKAHDVTGLSLYVDGGTKWDDDYESPSFIRMSYTTVTDDGEGSKVGTSFTYSPNSGSTMVEKAIGKPLAEVSDAMVGQPNKIIESIMAFSSHDGLLALDRAILETRLTDSLNDLLTDLEKEYGTK